MVGELGRDLEPSCPAATAAEGADASNDDDEVADDDDDAVEAAVAKEDADDGGMKPRGEPSIALADDWLPPPGADAPEGNPAPPEPEPKPVPELLLPLLLWA